MPLPIKQTTQEVKAPTFSNFSNPHSEMSTEKEN